MFTQILTHLLIILKVIKEMVLSKSVIIVVQMNLLN